MYSLKWAREVTKAHYKRYARATYLVLVSTHLTPEIVARWLAKSHESLLHRQLWSFWKAFIPVLDEDLRKRVPENAKHLFSKLTRSILSEVFWTFCENCPEWLWTARDWWVEHEEQFFKARPRARSLSQEKTGEAGQLAFF